MKRHIKEIIHSLGYDLTVSPIGNATHSKNIAFIHIAKCGGISIDNAFRKQFAKAGEKRLCRTTSIAASIASFNQPIQSMEDSCNFGEHHLQQLQGVLRYYLDLQYNYISGHWGVTPELLDLHAKKTDFVTVLRHPITRFRSNYIFNKLSNNLSVMPPNKLNNDDLIAEANEIVFGRRGWQMANTQTAFITGRYPTDEYDAECLHQLFLKQIKQFKLIGTLENLNEFKLGCSKTFGVDIDVKKQNKTDSITDARLGDIKDTLNEYFESKNIKSQLDKICKQEINNYNSVAYTDKN